MPVADPSPPRRHLPVVIVGGGQAGLSASYYLTQAGIAHAVIERHTRLHIWKADRWDTFCLVTPNWQCRLPHWPYRGDDSKGFMEKDAIVDYVEGFAASFDPPLHESTTVTRVERGADGRFGVDTNWGLWSAYHVIVASGGYDTPVVPPYVENLAPEIRQLHSRDYRRPSDVPEGTCLVVGAGQSGAQLMEDLWIAGRDVRLAVGSAPRSPRWYRGKDATDWLYRLGYYETAIDERSDPRATEAKTNHCMSGRDGGQEIDLRRYAVEGLPLYGSVTDMDGPRIRFAQDLGDNLDAADRSYVGIREMIDAYIDREGIDAPVEPPFAPVWHPEAEVTEIDAVAEGITSVLWCIGFRPDYSWLRVPCLDARGRPVHSRGVCEVPGVYFLGLGWLHTWGSGRFLAVGDDAAYVVGTIRARLDTDRRDAAAPPRHAVSRS